MPDPLLQAALKLLLEANPAVQLCHYDDPEHPTELHVYLRHGANTSAVAIEPCLTALKHHWHKTGPLTILTCHDTHETPQNANQMCQDEPISCGCQIQPTGADWLGTAGAPVKWIDSMQDEHWGILSNWHVMDGGNSPMGRGQCQPDCNNSTIARLSACTPVDPNKENLTDAAIADALIDGFHTISGQILGIGALSDTPLDASIGLPVFKAGRTTALTRGHCTGTGASARVSYGSFEAGFHNQDMFEGDDQLFSAPGDSGSLIIGSNCRCATALLFAGNSEITIGNPIRYVIEALDLVFPFP